MTPFLKVFMKILFQINDNYNCCVITTLHLPSVFKRYRFVSFVKVNSFLTIQLFIIHNYNSNVLLQSNLNPHTTILIVQEVSLLLEGIAQKKWICFNTLLSTWFLEKCWIPIFKCLLLFGLALLSLNIIWTVRLQTWQDSCLWSLFN